jgi:hypothetical protein
VKWWRGTSIDGLNSQAGVVVLRPTLVAFVPTAESKNLLGVMAGGVAKSAAGIHTISLAWLRRRPDPFAMVEDLWDERRDDFDACLVEAAEDGAAAGPGGRDKLHSPARKLSPPRRSWPGAKAEKRSGSLGGRGRAGSAFPTGGTPR